MTPKALILLALAGTLGAQTQLTLGSATSQAGGTATLPLMLASTGQAPAGVQWEFTVPVGISLSWTSFPVKPMSCLAVRGRIMRCVLDGGTAPLANGVIASLTFDVSADAQPGTVAIPLTSPVAVSPDAHPIPITATGGSLTITAAPISISSIVCSPDVLPSAGGKTTCNVSLSSPAATNTSVKLGYSSPGVSVTQRTYLTIGVGETSHMFSSVIGSTANDQAVTLTATLNGTTVSDTVTVQGTPPPPPMLYSFWDDFTIPGRVDDPDTSAVEIGLKFSSSSAGSITAIRFYKGPSNTGLHTGHLWNASGSLLASATFAGETASGWQQMALSTPVAITAGQTYTVSYNASKGQYAADNGYFTGPQTSGPLTATAGVYRYGGVAFPTSVYQQSNYWVDVVFQEAK